MCTASPKSAEAAVGDYLLGPKSDPVAVEFALEAKCYSPRNGVGVRHTSRLISRLRHRQFGVLVTTSHLDAQAYKEIREDGQPVVIITGRDLIDILKDKGLDNPNALRHLPARVMRELRPDQYAESHDLPSTPEADRAGARDARLAHP